MAKKRENWMPVQAFRLMQIGPHAVQLALRRNNGKVLKLEVSDRAYRYRARKNAPPRDCCMWCGSRKGLEVAHINGHEEDSSENNLAWTCRSCNVLCSNQARLNRSGRRTRQFNPSKGSAPYIPVPGNDGAKTAGQFVNAITSMRGTGGNMDYNAAVEMVYATPPARRSKFNKEIWTRRERVPF